MAKKAKKAKRARTYEVWVKRRVDGVITVKAKSAREAEKLAEEHIDDAWDFDDAADWFDGDPKCDIDVCFAKPKQRR